MRYIYSVCLFLFVFFGAHSVNATHIYGADFFYEFVSGNTYRITLVIYGDCKGQQFPTLNGASPQITVLESGLQKSTITLSQSGAGVEVTPVCAAMKDSTVCKLPSSSIPGVTRYTYIGYYQVNYTSASWVFRFAGVMGTSQAGRTNSITNIYIPGGMMGGGSVVTLEALLNNTNGNNSSPQFTTIPTPFYCINVAQQYNQGAVDVNGDSLVYSLAPGLQGTGYVTYNSGYTADTPVHSAAGSFSFNSVTGQLGFTPDIAQQSLVVNKVTEYRNGVVVGTSSREMTFVVLSNCNTKPASGTLDTAKSASSGGVVTSKYTINVCEGTDSVHFGIVPINPANDTLIASVSGLPSGATATITQNNTTNPQVTIDWKMPAVQPGTYNLYVTYKDNGCPITSTQTVAYTILVIKPNKVTTSILAPTQCVHRAQVQYNLSYGLVPRTIVIRKGGVVVDSFIDNSGTKTDSLGVGTYDVTITSANLLCPTLHSLTVVDGGTYPFTPKVVSPMFYCKDDISSQLLAYPDSGAILHWFNGSGLLLPVAPTPRTDTTGIFTWYTNQRFKVCESLRDSIKVYVTKRPVASFTGPDIICLDDTAVFMFNGTIGVGPILDYIWDWDDQGYTSGSDAGPWKIRWFAAGKKTITLKVEENKCPSFVFSKDIEIKPVPFAGFNIPSSVCQFDTVDVVYNTKPKADQDYSWTFTGANIPTANGIGPYTLRYNTAGSKHISLTVDLNGCSDTRDTTITVNPAPDAAITNVPGPVCIGDKAYLEATGGASYLWTPNTNLFRDPEGKLYALLLNPIDYKVMVTSDKGCVDSAFISYKDIQPCCTFSYPNAFTPNNDGRNDRFHIVTYGNQLEFELSVYNKWGQRVYYGLDPKQGWDGTFGGKNCEAGTYYYYLNAKCYTGHQETQKGDVILIR